MDDIKETSLSKARQLGHSQFGVFPKLKKFNDLNKLNECFLRNEIEVDKRQSCGISEIDTINKRDE
jgi:hypothetical protein